MSDTKRTIKVIGVGLPRTGTASLQRALQILGFTCHHMQTDILANPFPYRNGRQWIQIYDMTDKNLRKVSIKAYFDERNFDAVVDYPASLLPEDMAEIYPEAKFILSLRKSPQAWRTSFNATLDLTHTPWFLYSTYLMPSQFMLLQPISRQWEKLNAMRHNGSQVYRNNSTDIYTGHNEYIRMVVPKDRLLEHKASEGWRPLCEFLGVLVPRDEQGNEIRYPHVNDTKDIRKWFFVGAGMGVVLWAFWLMVLVTAYRLLFWTRSRA